MAVPDPTSTIPARPYPLPFDLAKTAVLVIDMQEGFCGTGGWWDAAGVDLSAVRAAVPRIQRVLAAARTLRIPVVYLKMDLEGSESIVDPRFS